MSRGKRLAYFAGSPNGPTLMPLGQQFRHYRIMVMVFCKIHEKSIIELKSSKVTQVKTCAILTLWIIG